MKAFINQDPNNLEIVSNLIMSQIDITRSKRNDNYKKNMIICFADNGNNLKVYEYFWKKEVGAKYNDFFFIILFNFNNNEKQNKDLKIFFLILVL